MELARLIEKIRIKHPELTEKEIMDKLVSASKRTGGLISDQILMRMIAAELGVQTEGNAASELTLFVKDLVPGLSNITVAGRVIAVFPSKPFAGSRNGKLASVFIVDCTGVLRVVFWNDKAGLIESGEVKVGRLVRFSRAYTREDLHGKAELHVGGSSEIELSPKDLDEADFPFVDKFTVKIADIALNHKGGRVSLAGTVESHSPISVFSKGEAGFVKVLRLILADDTGEIPVVVWNEKADELEKVLGKGASLRMVNAKVRKAVNDGIEVHVDSGTYVELAS
ncbi:hypothetical protein KEJ15_03435 [Candidatus Bathyarchaeota archaeon]|nr:hypothetical protein [Candidatus Bathyarchaeota archaeon]